MDTVYDKYKNEAKKYLCELTKVYKSPVFFREDLVRYIDDNLHYQLIPPDTYKIRDITIVIEHTPEGIRTTIGGFKHYSSPYKRLSS